jgi:hypothetical protein
MSQRIAWILLIIRGGGARTPLFRRLPIGRRTSLVTDLTNQGPGIHKF